MPKGNGQRDGGVALLVDFENLVRAVPCAGVDGKALMAFAAGFGPVHAGRAYADWRAADAAPHAEDFDAEGIEPVMVVGRRGGRAVKNAVDMRMGADAVDMGVSLPWIGVYVLVTGDRDFVPVVRALRRRGRTVVGVSPKCAASGEFVAHCDRFVPYGKLGGGARANAKRRLRGVLGSRRPRLVSLGYEADAARRRATVTRLFEAMRELGADGPFTLGDVRDRVGPADAGSLGDVVKCARLLCHGGALAAAGGDDAVFRERRFWLGEDAGSASSFVLAYEAALVARLAPGGGAGVGPAAVAAALGLDPDATGVAAYAEEVLARAESLAVRAKAASPGGRDDREGAGRDWFRWARRGMESGAVAANADGGWLHRIGDDAYAVVPDCFEAYAAAAGVGAKTAKNRVNRLGLHRQRRHMGGGADLFRAALANGRTVKGMLFPGALFWDGDGPEPGAARLADRGR